MIHSLGASVPVNQLRARNNYVGALSHSMGRQAIDVINTVPNQDYGFSIGSFPWWVNHLTKGQFIFDNDSWAGAVSGTTSQQMANSAQIAAAVSCKANTIIMWLTTNDRPAGFSLDDGSVVILGSAGTSSIPNAKALISAVLAVGKNILLVTDPPRGSATYTSVRLSSPQLDYNGRVRDWMRNVVSNLYPGRVFVLDTWPDMANTVSGLAGDARDGFNKDGLHPNGYSAIPLANKAIPILQGLGVPLRNVPIRTMLDSFDPTNPTGAINTTPMGGTGATSASAAGTSGSVTFSGTRPSNFGMFANSAAQASTINVACTFNALSPQTGGQADWFDVAITGNTGATANPAVYLQYQLSAPELALLNAGDKLTLYNEFEIDINGTGLRTLDAQIFRILPAGSERIRLAYVDTTFVLDGYLASKPMAGYHDGAGLYVTIDKTETGISLLWYFILAENASLNIRARIRKPAARKLI